MTIGLYGHIREKFGFEQEIKDDATILAAIAFGISIIALSLGVIGSILTVAAFVLLFYLMISDFLGASYPLVSHTQELVCLGHGLQRFFLA